MLPSSKGDRLGLLRSLLVRAALHGLSSATRRAERATAETLGREWLAVEPEPSYIAGSWGRFGRTNVSTPEGAAVEPDAVERFLRLQTEPCTRREIAEALGFDATPDQWRRVLTRLLARGAIRAKGETKARTYAAP